ncbi:hypothetical protein AGOR_G00172620 [Albula goreensis]|uniref:ITPR-interacting domain-containing protein n=1 Tax=Albula goreensis TaxID=1534307 RepID=A0A8T3CUA3_9TELE|nr:hypothetical protein AGOR_G00172620 [Albula goreensis]
MLATMDNNRNADRRALLVASREKWSRVEEQPTPRDTASGPAGNCNQDSVQQWLMSSCQEDGKLDPAVDTADLLRRQASAEDDLVLGVEASLYGKHTSLKSVQEFLRRQHERPYLTRWNSLTSAFSTNSKALSVMDVLNLWDDDPEELLLELGFGSEEPDISVKIPARFINHQSKARGINIQVFLEAQKNRMDLENPDVRNRFRELEVLQQVTSAFSALVTIPPAAPPPAQLTEVSRERRKKLSQLFRRASKRTLSMAQNEPDLPADTGLSANHSPDGVPGPLPSDRRPALKRCSRPGHPETSSLTPLVEEQTPNGSRDASDPPAELLQEEEGSARLTPPCVTPTAPLRRKSPGDLKAPESFEIEEIHSFDDSSVTGSTAGPTEGADAKFMRTNSCQSDSSGFHGGTSHPSSLTAELTCT